jgi:hypothetical protein
MFGSKLGQDSMLSDDDSFEEQFHGEVLINVIAPAGKSWEWWWIHPLVASRSYMPLRKRVSSRHKFKSAGDSCPWMARIAPV